MTIFDEFRRDQTGAAAVQYAVIAGVLTIAVIAGSLALRGSVVDLYDDMAAQANAALQVEPAAGPQEED